MFYSGDFLYNGIYSQDCNVYLVNESNDILNEYGINLTDTDEITLTFCYTNKSDVPLAWDEDMLKFVHEWFITDEYKEFSSDDDYESFYLLKGVSLVKRLAPDMTGLIDVTFKIYQNYAYKKQFINITDVTERYRIFNFSNVNEFDKPIFEIYDVKSQEISIINETLNQTFTINNLIQGIDVIVDNEYCVIRDVNGKNLIKHSNRDWFKLKKGSNEVSFVGDFKIKIKSLFPIKK